MSAALKFLKQTSLSCDRFCDNGTEKNLHYVIKNNEFSVLVELPDDVKTQTFSQLSLEANLLYDCSPKPKEVLQVRQRPYKYKGIVERGDPRKCTLQVSISILSSQHEDMNFVLEIKAKDTTTNSIVASGFSEPVQVISKPDVLRKKREPKKKKRTWNDRITETLERIEAKQNEALRLIQTQQNNSNSQSNSFDDAFQQIFGATTTSQHPSEEFENAFYSLVRAYNQMNESERPRKIRKLMDGNQFDPSVNELISTMHDQSVAAKKLAAFPPTLPSYTPVKDKTKEQSLGMLEAKDFAFDGLVEDLFTI